MPPKQAPSGARRGQGKASHIGSARRESRAAGKRSPRASRRAAQGIQHSDRPRTLDPTIHARKEPPRRRRAPANGQVAIATPSVPNYTNNVDAAKYGAMKEILLRVLPRKPPGLTQGEMFDAVRATASQGHFPGATHRWWAKSVQLDLEAKGVVVREPTSPLRWRLR